ncbi:hypothetical protein [Desulfitobacterium metallireducens]|uniref:Uncharacterized protein n=1 Tax=Desulfitobacterium metallireducens DSM 15288 TaxID=871968 RepID=W0ED82_9FIRM|nr:hypothetical protein [Desulfitobacterium metallireducens]AHF07493.1 hypothetical protein DESME_10955 [Desulfitobacterium metallireducens DSM 15288]
MNLWYLIAGLGFAGSGIYKIITNNTSVGITWIILGILFVLLARFSNKEANKDNKDSKNYKKK